MAKPIHCNSCILSSLGKGFAGRDLVPSRVPLTVATLEKYRDPNPDLSYKLAFKGPKRKKEMLPIQKHDDVSDGFGYRIC